MIFSGINFQWYSTNRKFDKLGFKKTKRLIETKTGQKQRLKKDFFKLKEKARVVFCFLGRVTDEINVSAKIRSKFFRYFLCKYI